MNGCHRVLFVAVLLWASGARAQSLEFEQPSGSTGYKLLKLPAFARSLALAGAGTALPGGPADQDVQPALAPPAALAMSVGWTSLPARFDAGIQHASWVWPQGTVALTGRLRHLGYRDLQGYDEEGRPTGAFGAATFAASVGASSAIGSTGALRLGGRVGYGRNHLAGQGSAAFVTDFGLLWDPPEGSISAGMSVRNWGVASRSGRDPETLPLVVTLGVARQQDLASGITVWVLADAQRPVDEPWRFPVAAEATWNVFTARLGHALGVPKAMPSFGLAVDVSGFRFETSIAGHSALGWSPAFELSLAL